MPTIKLVVIGASGVGKTSLRGKYISGRFSNGYRATIGADFITKTVPHPRNPDESVTLQIWDTAGQERFSSLSSAFFRGADAALLIFDVTSPESMHALKKWWNDFRDKAPVEDGDVHGYCCVVVGNKTDKDKAGNRLVGELEALEFIDELVPPFPKSPPPPAQQHIIIPQISFPADDSDAPCTPPRPITIAITPHQDSSPKHLHRTPRSTSTSASRYYTDTITTTRTFYHTPSSSISIYESARSSPEPLSPPPSRQRRLLGLSSSSSLSLSLSGGSSVATITPSLFAREREHHEPERGPKLFFTSAKTGEGVEDVFGYVVKRVVGRWEEEEAEEEAVGRLRDEREEVSEGIRLGEREEEGRGWSACCA